MPEIDQDKLEEMSQEDLVKLEDEVVEDDAKAELDDDAGKAGVAPGQEEKVVEDVAATVLKEQDTAGTQEGDEDLLKHVSPPSKWAQQRHHARDLETKLNEATTKLDGYDELQQSHQDLIKQVEWLKTAIKGQDADIPTSPDQAYSDEKIASVRKEYGDEMGDMLEAAKAALFSNEQKPAVKDDGEEGITPAPAAKPQPDEQPVADPKLLEAIDDNNELSWWREKSPPLWDKAIAVDKELLKDPAYVALPYKERFAQVVERVTTEVKAGAEQEKPLKPEDGGAPIVTLSGQGSAPTLLDQGALDKILNADPAVQVTMYESLPENQRDQVDVALGI